MAQVIRIVTASIAPTRRTLLTTRISVPLFSRIDLRLAAGDAVDHKGGGLVAEHARRPRRHSRKGDSFDRGALRQEPIYDIDRHMAADEVPVDFREMTTLEFRRNLVLGIHERKIMRA